MATVLVLHHNNLKKCQCHAATPWTSVILRPYKNRAHIVLQRIMWPHRRILGFSKLHKDRAANSLIQTLISCRSVLRLYCTLSFLLLTKDNLLWCTNTQNSPHRRSPGAVWRTPTSVAAGWSGCSTALLPVTHRHTTDNKETVYVCIL